MEEHYGEPLILYHWLEDDPIVTDIDVFSWNSGAPDSYLFDKTGVTVGSGTYLDDTAVASQTSAGPVPTFGHSLARLAAIETGEPQSGGNGLTGHDETGEDLASSWQDTDAQDPATESDLPRHGHVGPGRDVG